jgi:hypothetical protein
VIGTFIVDSAYFFRLFFRVTSGLVSETAINAAFTGLYNKESCAREDQGEPDWACERASDGTAAISRDCKKFRSLDVVMQIPLSMPVRPLYDKVFSAQLGRYINEGRYDRSKSKHTNVVYQQSACGADRGGASVSESQLGVSGMLGTILTAMFFQVLAMLLWAIESLTGRPLAKLVGLGSKRGAVCEGGSSRDVATTNSLQRFDSTFAGVTTLRKFDMSVVLQDADDGNTVRHMSIPFN